MTYPPELPVGNGDRFPSREEILKLNIAMGILANPNTNPKAWGSAEREQLGTFGRTELSWFEHSVNNAYQVLFENKDEED